ncbi:hypothetical protein Dimus_023218 [Dionaea muscipula]
MQILRSSMAWKAIHLLVIILACSYFIISSSSTPISRTRHLFHERQDQEYSAASDQIAKELMASGEAIEDDSVKLGSMDFQINDYAPAGANPYHTPRPPHA